MTKEPSTAEVVRYAKEHGTSTHEARKILTGEQPSSNEQSYWDKWDVASLRAEIERLTRERDWLIEERAKESRADALVVLERDRLRAELEACKERLRQVDDWPGSANLRAADETDACQECGAGRLEPDGVTRVHTPDCTAGETVATLKVCPSCGATNMHLQGCGYIEPM